MKDEHENSKKLELISYRIVLLFPKLQSHFAEFLQLYYSIALVCSTHPPVSDFIRSTTGLNYRSRTKKLKFISSTLALT